MIRALYSAASGMSAQETNIDNIANNLANANTVGFKSRRAQFQDLMYQSLVQPGTASGQQTVVPTGLQLGLGTRAASNEIIFTQGAFTETDNPLDLVIQGNGFFQIQMPNGEFAYTRSGTFHLDAQGQMVTADGNPLQPSITIPTSATTVVAGFRADVTTERHTSRAPHVNMTASERRSLRASERVPPTSSGSAAAPARRIPSAGRAAAANAAIMPPARATRTVCTPTMRWPPRSARLRRSA